MTSFYFNGDRDFVTHINRCNTRAEDVKCNYSHIAAHQIVKISLVFEAHTAIKMSIIFMYVKVGGTATDYVKWYLIPS